MTSEEEYKKIRKEKIQNRIKNTLTFTRNGEISRYAHVKDYREYEQCSRCGSNLVMRIDKAHTTRKQVSVTFKCLRCEHEWSVMKAL